MESGGFILMPMALFVHSTSENKIPVDINVSYSQENQERIHADK